MVCLPPGLARGGDISTSKKESIPGIGKKKDIDIPEWVDMMKPLKIKIGRTSVNGHFLFVL
jgi:hypothetical protein